MFLLWTASSDLFILLSLILLFSGWPLLPRLFNSRERGAIFFIPSRFGTQDKKRGNMARMGDGERFAPLSLPCWARSCIDHGVWEWNCVPGETQAAWLWNGVQEQGMLQAGWNRHFGDWLWFHKLVWLVHTELSSSMVLTAGEFSLHEHLLSFFNVHYC